MKIHVNVPLFVQPINSSWCVPNGLFGVLYYFEIEIGMQEFRRRLKSHWAGGTDLKDVRPVLNELGLSLQRIPFEYEAMLIELEAGNPIVLAYSLIEDRKEYGHFSTLIGLRKDNKRIAYATLNDTYFGRIEIPFSMLHRLVKADEHRWVRAISKR